MVTFVTWNIKTDTNIFIYSNHPRRWRPGEFYSVVMEKSAQQLITLMGYVFSNYLSTDCFIKKGQQRKKQDTL